MKNYKSKTLSEEFSSEDISKLRALIRKEVANIFFDLYRKKSTWSGK